MGRKQVSLLTANRLTRFKHTTLSYLKPKNIAENIFTVYMIQVKK
uniref:Uncharacterized protein n=1 Tax=Rhizophora mucronata TaxID=61149 RepID=A0A2P2QTR8_RHIMU